MNSKSNTITAIAKSTMTAIESPIEVLTQLIEDLQNYRNCIHDFFQLQQENDRTEVSSFLSQSHTLPGVISLPHGSKIDYDEREKRESNLKQILQQKRILSRLIQKNSNFYIQAFKEFKKNDILFEEFVDILDGNINLDLEPCRFDFKTKSKPDIKLEVKNCVGGNKKK